MSTRHVRTPRETFLSDQALAHARDEARVPGTIAVVLDYATDGQCSWCDCPDGPNSPHNQDGYACAGCPADAYYLVHLMNGGPVRRDIPVCATHHPDVVRMITSLIGTKR